MEDFELFREFTGELIQPIKFGSINTSYLWYSSNELIFTPEKTVEDMLDLLPVDIWNPHTKFLDPCVKSGVFLCKIRDKLDKELLVLPEYSDPASRMLHILNNQIYGISLVDNDLLWLIQRRVYGRIFVDNLKYIENYKELVLKSKFSELLGIIKLEEVFGMTRFDVVIGNPPYQSDKDAKLYCKFMLFSSSVADRYSCMIVKNKWMTSVDKAGTNGFTDVRQHFLVNKHCEKLIDYPTVGEVFKDIGTSVCYYLSNERGQSDCEYTRIGGGRYLRNIQKTLVKLA